MTIPRKVDVLALANNETAGILAANEVSRIGRQADIFWNIMSAWDSVCINSVAKKSTYMSKQGPFSCLRGHYHIIKKNIDMGRESVWVCEDDVRFLKDVVVLNEALAKAPDDADILLLDYLVWSDEGSMDFVRCKQGIESTENGWWEVDNEDLRGAGDYIMSRRAMERYAEILSMGATKGEMIASDVGRTHQLFPGFHIYAAYPNLSIQQEDNSYLHMSGNIIKLKYGRNNGLEFEKYQEW